MSKGKYKNFETVAYSCGLCLDTKYQKISPGSRRWKCDCGSLYVIVSERLILRKEERLKNNSDKPVIRMPSGSFSIWSKKGKEVFLKNSALLVQKGG